jgi:hypothetical protein
MAAQKPNAPGADRGVGGRKKFDDFKRSLPTSPVPSKSNRSWSIYSGRKALGAVELIDGVFTAIDVTGTVIGTFATLHEAARALPKPAEVLSL